MRHRAVVGDQRAQPLAKSTMSGTWAKTLLATTRSARPCAVGDVLARLLAEEHAPRCGCPSVAGDLGDVGGRLDPQAPDAARDDVLQQVAVVARHLDDEGRPARGRAAPPRRRRSGVACATQRVGVRGEVRVVGEDVLAPRCRRAAAPAGTRADPHVQRVERLRRCRAGRRAGSSRTAATSPGRRTSLVSSAPHSRQSVGCSCGDRRRLERGSVAKSSSVCRCSSSSTKPGCQQLLDPAQPGEPGRLELARASGRARR